MGRLEIYHELKNGFDPERYAKVVKDRKQRGLLAKARMGTVPLHIETGQYRDIAKDERLCQGCVGSW